MWHMPSDWLEERRMRSAGKGFSSLTRTMSPTTISFQRRCSNTPWKINVFEVKPCCCWSSMLAIVDQFNLKTHVRIRQTPSLVIANKSSVFTLKKVQYSSKISNSTGALIVLTSEPNLSKASASCFSNGYRGRQFYKLCATNWETRESINYLFSAENFCEGVVDLAVVAMSVKIFDQLLHRRQRKNNRKGDECDVATSRWDIWYLERDTSYEDIIYFII